ncbi:hypothetical protein L218DRAFT_986664 [Marasmius fiardii PR-910]|nr:hypothetical protein L218DRAFT_986664 [Marasmius fiardii PR-910]
MMDPIRLPSHAFAIFRSLKMETVDASKDFAVLAIVGRNYILTLVGLLTTAVLYGIYTVLFFAATSILWRRRGSIMSVRTGLLVTVIVLFLLSTIYITANFSYFVIGINMLLIENPGTVPVMTKNAAYLAKFRRLGVVGQVTVPVACVIGDSIVIWRAWALSVRKKIMFLPVILLLGLTASCFSFVECMVREDLPVVISPRCRKRNIATFALSVATNAAGTAVIGHYIWSYRRTVKKYLQCCRHQLWAGKVLAMFLESGVIYTTIWTIQLAEILLPVSSSIPDQTFRQVFSAMAAQLVGIYPTLMVVLVFLRRSLWDPAGKSTICDTIPDLDWQSRGVESNNLHGHDLVRSKLETGSSEVGFSQENHSYTDSSRTTVVS